MSEPTPSPSPSRKGQRRSKIRRRTGSADPPPIPWKRAAIAFAIIAFLSFSGLLLCLLFCSNAP